LTVTCEQSTVENQKSVETNPYGSLQKLRII